MTHTENEYAAVIEKAKSDRARLEEERKRLEHIDQQIKALDAIIINAGMFTPNGHGKTIDKHSSLEAVPIPKPDLANADLIHLIMDELGIETFRMPQMHREFVKRGWADKTPSASVVLRSAALRREGEFVNENGTFRRIGKPK